MHYRHLPRPMNVRQANYRNLEEGGYGHIAASDRVHTFVATAYRTNSSEIHRVGSLRHYREQTCKSLPTNTPSMHIRVFHHPMPGQVLDSSGWLVVVVVAVAVLGRVELVASPSCVLREGAEEPPLWPVVVLRLDSLSERIPNMAVEDKAPDFDLLLAS